MTKESFCRLPKPEVRLLIEIMEGVCCLSCTLAGKDECWSWTQMSKFIRGFRRDRRLNVYHVGSACKSWRGTGGREMEGRSKPVRLKDV